MIPTVGIEGECTRPGGWCTVGLGEGAVWNETPLFLACALPEHIIEKWCLFNSFLRH